MKKCFKFTILMLIMLSITLNSVCVFANDNDSTIILNDQPINEQSSVIFSGKIIIQDKDGNNIAIITENDDGYEINYGDRNYGISPRVSIIAGIVKVSRKFTGVNSFYISCFNGVNRLITDAKIVYNVFDSKGTCIAATSRYVGYIGIGSTANETFYYPNAYRVNYVYSFKIEGATTLMPDEF